MIRTLGLMMAICLALIEPAAAENAAEKGLRIAQEAKRQDEGFHSYTAVGNMILRDRHGRESPRDFNVKALEVKDDGDKSLIVFDHPNDIRNTALLTFSHKTGNDDQWLYLPAVRRIKRITSDNKSGSFVGSEFAYEDLISTEVEKFTYKWLRDEACPDAEELICYVNERYPVDDSSGYSREVVWIDHEAYRLVKVNYFDRKDALLKTLTSRDYKQYRQKYWRPSQMLMLNHQTGKSTVMIWRDYDFTVDLTESDLSKRALKRLR